MTVLLKRGAADPCLTPAGPLNRHFTEPRVACAMLRGRTKSTVLRSPHVRSARGHYAIVKGKPAADEASIDMTALERFREYGAVRKRSARCRAAVPILCHHADR